LLKAKFPESYPAQFCSVEMLVDQDIPPEAVEVFNMAAESYWSADMQGTLMFRPFFHWVDKNIVELLHIQPKTRGSLDKNEDGEQTASSDSDDSARDEEEEETGEAVNASCPLIKSKKGTEIRLMGLNTSQSLGTAYWPVISVVLACSRCKHHKEVQLKEER